MILVYQEKLQNLWKHGFWVLDLEEKVNTRGLWMRYLFFSHSVMSDSWWPHGRKPTRLLCPWNFPDKNSGVGCHFLLQGIFWPQGPNPCLLHWQADSLLLSHRRSPVKRIVSQNKYCLVNYPQCTSWENSDWSGYYIYWKWFISMVISNIQFSSVQSLSRVQLFATPWIASRQASLSITNSWSSLKFTPIESVMPSSHLILCHPLLLLPLSLYIYTHIVFYF